jgi:hypothetical protein
MGWHTVDTEVARLMSVKNLDFKYPAVPEATTHANTCQSKAAAGVGDGSPESVP